MIRMSPEKSYEALGAVLALLSTGRPPLIRPDPFGSAPRVEIRGGFPRVTQQEIHTRIQRYADWVVQRVGPDGPLPRCAAVQVDGRGNYFFGVTTGRHPLFPTPSTSGPGMPLNPDFGGTAASWPGFRSAKTGNWIRPMKNRSLLRCAEGAATNDFHWARGPRALADSQALYAVDLHKRTPSGFRHLPRCLNCGGFYGNTHGIPQRPEE
jgi:hypothetical protein